MNGFSKQTLSAAARQYGPMILGLRVPGFIRVHGRYARRNFVTWFVLFIAPFAIGVMCLSLICTKLLEVSPSRLQLFFMALFLVALAFFFAERHRKFRRIYVTAIPIMVIVNGLFNLFFIDNITTGNLVSFALFALLPAWWLGRHATGKGYRLLSDGADKNYRPGRDLYVEGQYAKAFVYLEPSAKQGHMKSLYWLGHACENGNGRAPDRIKAARFYDKAGRKGYRKAGLAFETLFETFSDEEREAFEADLGIAGFNELF